MTREPYTYVILRYRHDPLAGEQINVGVVVHAAKSGFLGAVVRRAYGRISKLFPSVDGTALRHDLVNIERALQRLGRGDVGGDMIDKPNASTFAHRVLAKDDSSLIWSEIGSGLTRDPAKTLDELHARFVTQYDEPTTTRRFDADIWRPFRDLLLERKIDGIFQSKTITGAHDAVEFDYAWKNGKWHCFQPLSFDLTTAEGIQEKAARWVGHMLGLQEAENLFKPYFIVGRPSDPALMPIYDRAIDFIGAAPLQPTIVSETDIGELADQLADKVNTHLHRDTGAEGVPQGHGKDGRGKAGGEAESITSPRGGGARQGIL